MRGAPVRLDAVLGVNGDLGGPAAPRALLWRLNPKRDVSEKRPQSKHAYRRYGAGDDSTVERSPSELFAREWLASSSVFVHRSSEGCVLR